MCVLCLPFGYFLMARSMKPGSARELIGVYGLMTGKNCPFGFERVKTAARIRQSPVIQIQGLQNGKEGDLQVRSSPLTVLSEGSAKRKRFVSWLRSSTLSRRNDVNAGPLPKTFAGVLWVE